MNTCSKCGQHSDPVVGRQCRACVNKYQREYKRSGKGALTQKRYQAGSNFKAYQRAYRLREKDRLKQYHKNYYLQAEYGITLEQYEQMLNTQGRRCAICHKSDSEAGTLAVDHCHTTDRVRELLCQRCNQGLGLFKENPTALARAIAYLERHV